jgi:hypothetical protein
MMADMAENQPPAEPPTPPTGLPALPTGAPLAQPPPGLDADEYRRFQEFQRFQDFQRFAQGQQGDQPVPAPQHHELATHLADMRQQLARIERVTNPPTWQKVLRNKWLHRLIWLVVVVVGLSIAYQHFFGSSGTNNPDALHPGQIQHSGRLAPNPQDAVAAVYHLVGENAPDSACLEFAVSARAQFARDVGAADCAAAVAKIYQQLGSAGRTAYDNVRVPDTAVTTTGSTAEVSSCGMVISAGPRLGVFTLTEDQFQEWQITGHRSEPDPCPAPPTTSDSAPPTS